MSPFVGSLEDMEDLFAERQRLALAKRVAALEADCKRLRDLLRQPQVQWGNRGWTDDRPLVGHCPLCDQPENKDHAPDCPIGAELEVQG